MPPSVKRSKTAANESISVIKLFQFPPAFGLPNASPFCMKLETYLRMTELPFEVVRGAHMRTAPKGKLPYIEDGDKRIADSSLIIEYLKQTYGDALDAGLTLEQRAMALAMQRLMEESLYWVMAYSRWIEPAGIALMKQEVFAKMPLPVRVLAPVIGRRVLGKELHGHGIGRHAREEIYEIGKRDITALADFLGAKPFMMGNDPHSLDACAYAFVANLVWTPFEGPLKQHARGYTQFTTYCQRMRQRYYS